VLLDIVAQDERARQAAAALSEPFVWVFTDPEIARAAQLLADRLAPKETPDAPCDDRSAAAE
jgi:hypothetical protein